MKKLILTLALTLFLITAVSATDVAYVVTNNLHINDEFINVLTDLGLTYSIIYASDASTTDFDNYNVILLNNEDFPNPGDIPINDYPALMVNGRNMEDWGWVTSISLTKQNSPLHAKILDLNHDIADGLINNDVQVYTSKDPTLYYLGESNKFDGIQTFASTINVEEEIVIGYVEAGTTLTKTAQNPTQVNARSVFFGIHETQYWTPETRQLFENSLLWLMQEPPVIPTYDIQLNEGYNLVSFPIILEDNTVQNILDSNLEIASITRYTGTGFASASTIQNNQAYYIQTTSATTLTVEGQEPTEEQSVNLNQGMNLVGITSLSTINLNTLPSQIIEISKRNPDGTFTIATKYNNNWYNSFVLEPGKGYWFKLNQGVVWEYSP